MAAIGSLRLPSPGSSPKERLNGREANLQVRSRRGHSAYRQTLALSRPGSEGLGDEVIARLNPDTGEMENLEVLFFSTRLSREVCELPISAELRITTGE
jgi:hypothetical protein